MSIKAVLFDVDDTLLDFPFAERQAVRACFGFLHMGHCSDEMLERYSTINREYWKKLELGQMTKAQILVARFRDLFSEYGLDVTKAEDFNAEYQVRLGDYVAFHNGALELLEALKGKVWLAAVTNGTKVAQTKKLLTSGLNQCFDGIFISEDVGFEKPSPLFFQRVFEQMPETLSKEEILIVGDSLSSDIQGGVNAGIKTCWYNPKNTKNSTGLKPDYEIHELSKVLDIITDLQIQISIKKDFPRIVVSARETTLGGSQEFFSKDGEEQDQIKRAMGCGIVSLCDSFLYFGEKRNQSVMPELQTMLSEKKEQENHSKDSYIKYYNVIYKLAGGVSKRNGMSGFKLARVYNRIAKKEGISLGAHWHVGYRNFLAKITEMLKQDIPVVLSIPVVLGKKKGFPMLVKKTEKSGIVLRERTKAKAHFVTVVGIAQKEGKAYLQISSWGREYFLDAEEYIKFGRRQFLGFLTGNILCVKKSKA